eukprot:1160018-Pelagomonas_calceolata.AAC.1
MQEGLFHTLILRGQWSKESKGLNPWQIRACLQLALGYTALSVVALSPSTSQEWDESTKRTKKPNGMPATAAGHTLPENPSPRG